MRRTCHQRASIPLTKLPRQFSLLSSASFPTSGFWWIAGHNKNTNGKARSRLRLFSSPPRITLSRNRNDCNCVWGYHNHSRRLLRDCDRSITTSAMSAFSAFSLASSVSPTRLLSSSLSSLARPTRGAIVIHKPQTEDRSYEFITLPNQLGVVLISDPTSEKAAAALACRVGYFSDPAEIPGLAHFTEHMLFLGNEKYPVEGSYKKFLSHHGGRCNAYTAQESTNFHFDVAASYLEPALDHFSAFFVKPLFTEDATDREMKAVDSENKNNLQSDPRRFTQVVKHLSHPAHPFAKFGTGNLHTLKHIPRANKINVRQALLRFYQDHYSSNLMKLCVLGREPLEVLRRWVTEKFSHIPNLRLPLPSWPSAPLAPFDASQMQRQINIIPVKNQRKLHLHFPLPYSMRTVWKSKPERFWSHLLGHEGEGSIYALLRARGWTTALSAGESFHGSTYSIFGITIELTPQGMDHVTEIVEYIFAYLRAIPSDHATYQWIFEEASALAEMHFRFRSKADPYGIVSNIAEDSHWFPPEQVLSGPALLQEFRPDLIQQVRESLRLENMRLYVSSKDFEVMLKASPALQLMQQEPWYGTRFQEVPLDPKQVERWKESSSSATPRELFLPARNPFVVTNFDLAPLPPTQPHAEGSENCNFFRCSSSAAAKTAPNSVPVEVNELSTRRVRVWFLQDTTFRVPKVCFRAYLFSPLVYESPTTLVLAKLFCAIVDDDLNQLLYSAALAGYSYDLGVSTVGLDLQVDGYHQKLGVVLQHLIEAIHRDYSSKHDRFQVLVMDLQRRLENTRKDSPAAHANQRLSHLLTDVHWTAEQQLEVLLTSPSTVTLPAMVDWARRFLSHFTTWVYVHGNLTNCTDLVRSCFIQPLQQEVATVSTSVDTERGENVAGGSFAAYRSKSEFSERVSGDLYATSSITRLRRRTVCLTTPLRTPTLTPSESSLQLPKTYLHVFDEPNRENVNSAVVVYFQVGLRTLRSDAKMQLLTQLFQPLFFQKLRTEHQVGYSVHFGMRVQSFTAAFAVTIQSNNTSPWDVEAKVLEFFRAQGLEFMLRLPEPEFAQAKAALVQRLKQKDIKLVEEAERFWGEIASEQFCWHRQDLLVELVQELTLPEVLEFYQTYLLPPFPAAALAAAAAAFVATTASSTTTVISSAAAEMVGTPILSSGQTARQQQQQLKPQFPPASPARGIGIGCEELRSTSTRAAPSSTCSPSLLPLSSSTSAAASFTESPKNFSVTSPAATSSPPGSRYTQLSVFCLGKNHRHQRTGRTSPTASPPRTPTSLVTSSSSSFASSSQPPSSSTAASAGQPPQSPTQALAQAQAQMQYQSLAVVLALARTEINDIADFKQDMAVYPAWIQIQRE